MRRALVCEDANLWIDYSIVICVNSLKKFLHNHRLYFEAANVAVIDHYGESFSKQLCKHKFVEFCGQNRLILDDYSNCMHWLKAEVHELRFLMLHGKNYDEHYVLKHLLLEIE